MMMRTTIAVAALAVTGGALAPVAGASEAKYVRTVKGYVACEVSASRTFCQTRNKAATRGRAVTLRRNGSLSICKGVSCIGDPPVDLVTTLRPGRSVKAGRFTCRAGTASMRCTVASGKGFKIWGLTVRRLG